MLGNSVKSSTFNNLPTSIQKAYQNDPSLAIALMAQKSGMSTAPVKSAAEGWARALQGMAGTYEAEKIRKEYDTQGQKYNNDLSDALMTAQKGVPAWVNPDTEQQAIPAIDPGRAAYVAALQSKDNPYLANTVAEQQVKVIDDNQKAAEQDLKFQNQLKLIDHKYDRMATMPRRGDNGGQPKPPKTHAVGAGFLKQLDARMLRDYPEMADDPVDPAALKAIQDGAMENYRKTGDFESAYRTAHDTATGGRGLEYDAPFFGRNSFRLPKAMDASAATPGVGAAPVARASAASNTFDDLPNPMQFKGKFMRDSTTGKRLMSDGRSWKEVR